MTKPTPLYSAFGIVALESIWPSSRGDEVPLNFTDVTLLSERVELSLPDGKGGSFTDYQETLKEKEANAKEVSEELSNELRSFSFAGPVVNQGSRSRESSDPTYSRDQQIDLRVLDLFNNDEWPSGYEFSYFDEDGNEVVVDSNEDLKSISLDPEGKVVSSTEEESNVSDIDSGNEFDERYYSVSPNQKRVLNTLWENMLPDSEGVKVTSVSGSYPEGGTHYGFDVVGLPQQNSVGQEPLVAYPLETKGEVVLAGVRGSSNSADAYGNSVVVKIDGSNLMIAFSHLSEVFVSVGDKVSQGTSLGRQGNTGISSGDHVDVEVREFYGVSEDGTRVSAGGPPNASEFSSFVEPYVGEVAGSNLTSLQDINFNSLGDDDPAFKTEVIQNLYGALKEGEVGYDESNIVPGVVEVKTISFSTERVSFSDDSSPREIEQKINSLKNDLESLKGKLESGEYSKENLENNYSLGDITIMGQTPTEVSGSSTSLNSLHDTYLNRIDSTFNYLNSELISSKVERLSTANDDVEDFSQNIINSQEYAMYPKAHVRPGFSSSLTSEEAYKKRRGYFKIIPLNVLQISTNTSTGGTIGQSSFNVSFTLDDVIIVADEYGEKGIFDSLSSTALPISVDGVFDELYKVYGGEIPDTLRKEIVPYGFSAYRISGNNFTFNLEDVLEANDTATIWLYHDPKEFDFITKNTLIKNGEGSGSDDNGEDSQNGEENDVNPSPYENDTDVQELIKLWKREEIKISGSVSNSISGVNIDFDSYDEYVKILRTSSPEERQAIINHYQDKVNKENSSSLLIQDSVKKQSRVLLDVAVNIDNEVSPESSNPRDDVISTNPDSSESIEVSGPVRTYRVKDNKVSVRVAGKSIEKNGEYQNTIIESSLYRNPTKPISGSYGEDFDSLSLISEKSNDDRSIYAVDDSGEFLMSDDEFNEFSTLKKSLDAFYILESRSGAGVSDPRLRKAVGDIGSIRNVYTLSLGYSTFETPADDTLDSFSEEIKVYNRYVDLKTKVESDEYTEEEKDAFVKDFEDFLIGVFISSSNETLKEKNNLRSVISEEIREVENTFVKEYPPPYTEEEEPVSNTPTGNENDVSEPGFGGGGGGEENRNDNFYTENYFDYVNNFIENKDFSYVIGTGARKSSDDYKLLPEDERSFFNVPKTEIQSILIDAEVLSPYVSQDKLEKIKNGEEVVNLSSGETLDILIAMGRRANLSGFNNRDLSRSPTSDQNQNYLEYLSENIFGGSSLGGRGNDEINKKRFKGFMNDLFLADYDRFNERFSDSSVGAGDASPLVQVNPQLYRETFLATSGALRSLLNSSVYDKYVESGDPDDLETLINNFKLNTTESGLSLGELYTSDEIAELFNFVNSFSKDAERLVEGALEFFADQNETEEIVPSFDKRGFYNKRKLLVSKSHGETPYLVLKGHISTVESKYGASQGSHVVTISGGGYEKILNENIVYFEDLFFPGGETRNKIVDANTIYSNMLPPEALLSFVETHVPRYIVIGKKSKTIKDTQNYSLQFFTSSIDKKATELEYDPEEGGYVERPIPEPLDVTDNENFFLKEDDILVRGKAVFNFSQTRNSSEEENVATGEVTDEPSRSPMVRVFYPINYLNTSRIQEMINATTNVFEDEEEVQIRIPIKITSKQSVASNMLNFNGPKEINHMFVDETGRLRQRLAFEAWERTPNPAYTPTIMDDDVLASGASFANNSDSISTMVDVTPNYLTSGSGIVSALFSGRTLASGNDYIPIISSSNIEYLNLDDTLYSNFYESMSEEFFRYGMRYKKINDIYTTSTAYAERKSILYQSFFSKPIKTAKVPLKGNSSYRAGETVLVYLDNYRYRSQEMIDIEKTYDWLQYLKTSPDKDRLLPIYIGVDERWLNHDSYYLTSQLDQLPEYSSWLDSFKNNPHEFVLDQFIATFEYLRYKLISNTTSGNLIYVTPDYFPMTWWAFNRDPSLSLKFTSRVRSGSAPTVPGAYNLIYDVLLGSAVDNKIPELLKTSGEIMNAIRMQNFRVASYYIDAVQHDFVHGENFTTNLTLNHGQDNLAIVEPFGMKPIGFMSIEKRMKIGYDDAVVDENGSLVFPSNPNRNTSQRSLWLDFDSKEKSEIQKFYIDQFHQDKTFKENSFLFRSQLNRNSSNFMYELGLDLGLDN